MTEPTRAERVCKRLGIEIEEVRGERAWAKCPFHEDAKPSWMIRVGVRRHAQFYCFSCKNPPKGEGTIAHLVMHVRGCTYEQAREWLAADADEDAIPDEDPALAVSIEMVGSPRMFRLPLEMIRDPLPEWVTPARRYAERRGITPAQVSRWGIGYAVDGRLAGRIVLPVFTRDRACSYMARDFTGDPSAPRYFYPDGRRELPDLDGVFGEHLWPAPAFRETIVITEGALNALAVERAYNFDIAVGALGGSDLRPMHAFKISSFKRAIVLTDPDDAGDKVATKLAQALARHAPNSVRVRLPEGMDANDMRPEDLRAATEGWIGALPR